MHVQITQAMGVHDDLELQEYVQRVGEKVARVSERPDLDWKFTIVDTDDVNAFATQGGYVYISRGILPYMQNEAQLAAVLGHEIGHITAKHLQAQKKKSALAGSRERGDRDLHGHSPARRPDQHGGRRDHQRLRPRGRARGGSPRRRVHRRRPATIPRR